MRAKRGCSLLLPAFALFCLAAAPASAALAPYWQRLRELQAILADLGLTEALGSGDPIISVAVTAEDTYEIRTARCSVVAHTVDVEPLPGAEPVVGPRRFSIAYDK